MPRRVLDFKTALGVLHDQPTSVRSPRLVRSIAASQQRRTAGGTSIGSQDTREHEAQRRGAGWAGGRHAGRRVMCRRGVPCGHMLATCIGAPCGHNLDAPAHLRGYFQAKTRHLRRARGGTFLLCFRTSVTL